MHRNSDELPHARTEAAIRGEFMGRADVNCTRLGDCGYGSKLRAGAPCRTGHRFARPSAYKWARRGL